MLFSVINGSSVLLSYWFLEDNLYETKELSLTPWWNQGASKKNQNIGYFMTNRHSFLLPECEKSA